MRVVLCLLAVGLCAQAAFGKLEVLFAGVQPVNEEDGHLIRFANLLREEPLSGDVPQADIVPSGDRQLRPSRISEDLIHRQLIDVFVWIKIRNAPPNALFRLKLTIIKNGVVVFMEEYEFTTNNRGEFTFRIFIDMDCLNVDMTGVCPECKLQQEELQCPVTGCADNLIVLLHGDPHMVGLLGQKIDWAGEDNGWYCLFSDGPDFHVNVRLSAPMPVEFPDRQLISAVSVLTEDGLHSLVVEVKNPYSTDTDACPKDSSVPCLADGGLWILVDGEESAAMRAPAVNVLLPGSSPVVVSAANLPAECRLFGGDRIWATQFAAMTSNHRNLRSDSVSFADWILQPDTLAAPTWCAKYLKEGGEPGLLSTRAKHATLRVETPAADVRINVGVNYQDLETDPDGTVLVPELEVWQTDLGFGDLKLSGNVAGIMGDTARYVLDGSGVPVTSGLGALHAPVESYRVAGPFARDFEKLHE